MIKYVAIKQDDTIYCLPKPFRHHDVIRTMVDVCKLPKPVTGEQGFMTNDGDFVDRKEALEIAFSCGQVEEPIAPPNLFSEDLW